MTAVFINEKLLGFIPKETPIYGNTYTANGVQKQNDNNHKIIKEWLLKRCKHFFEDNKKTMVYLPDEKSEFNGSLIINNKTLLRVTTTCDINVYLSASYLIQDAAKK